MVESYFENELEKFKLQPSALGETPKSGKKEQEKTVHEIIEVIAPILIKTVCAAMHLQIAHLDKEVQSLKTGLAARDERSEAVRDEGFRARTRLKDYNRQCKDNQIHVTAKRAILAYRTRQLKRQKHIADCWAYAGRVVSC